MAAQLGESFCRGSLVVQNNAEQRTVDLQTTGRAARIIHEPELPEPVHEKAHPRTGGAHHFGQAFLTDFGHDRLRHAFLAEVSEKKKDASQPLFAGVEQLVNQILFIAHIPSQQIRRRTARKMPSSRWSAAIIAFLSMR